MKIPQYNPVQKILKRIFYSPQQSVFIFTEDNVGDKLFYEILLKRLEDSTFKIQNIEPLGPKSVVIEHSIQDKNPKLPTLYIVDGDIKLMFGKKLENHNLISLDRYCIENYLCCESGIINYLIIKTGLTQSQIKSKLQFSTFLYQNGKQLLNLYYHYAISFELGCGCSFKKVENLIVGSGKFAKIDRSIVASEIKTIEKTIKLKLKSQGNKNFNVVFQERLSKIRVDNDASLSTIIKVLSGKDVLLPLIKHRIDFIDNTSRSLSKDQLNRLLAEKVLLAPLEQIKQKIISLL